MTDNVHIHHDFRIQLMFGLSLPPVVCTMARVLFTLSVCVCEYSGAFCGFFFFVLSFVYPTLPVSLYGQYFASSVFSNVHFRKHQTIISSYNNDQHVTIKEQIPFVHSTLKHVYCNYRIKSIMCKKVCCRLKQRGCFQLYHDKNMFLFDEMVMMSALY